MRIFFFALAFLLLIGLIPAACGGGYAALQVLNSDYSQFQKSRILEILSKETILFYGDGTSQLGSLFGQEHRIYVTIDKIPASMKDAIVCAEDEDFYTNIGIDFKGIVRAAIHNMLFRTRQGASTITQQTVKNLYGRKETDLATKFQETINAFKLERMYSKDQILEFYLNQFHVTGNGRGIGVAAKYYFNKDVSELTLIETAFIAGSVKGPEKYNPFTKTTAASQERAKREAFSRKNYVLERLLKNNKITKSQYDTAIVQQVPFNQGRFQYNELAINQVVQKQLAKPEILRAIGATNVDEIGTMGLQITTTLDKDIQRSAQYGLKQNLSSMQMMLKGFAIEPATRFQNIQNPELYNFYVGHLDSLDHTEGHESLRVSFGLPSCTVETDSLHRAALKTYQISKPGLQKSTTALLKTLAVGQYVLVSIKQKSDNDTMTCDLETRPQIQGAALVLEKGKVMAMAGGFSSNEYNRALFAQRQPGSTFKIPTYYAALQLGWSVLDTLPNVRDAFLWQGNLYFPRPDHPPTTLETTILGAGAKSENLASVWLLAHILDKLDYNQFEELLRFLGILENNDVPQALSRIANKFNASADNRTALARGVLNRIKDELANDSSVANSSALRVLLRTMHYGLDADRQQELITASKTLSDKEKSIQINILRNDLLRWREVANNVVVATDLINRGLRDSTVLRSAEAAVLSQFERFDETDNTIAFRSGHAWRPELTSALLGTPSRKPLSPEELLAFANAHRDALNPENILLDGVIPLSLVELIGQKVDNLLADLDSKSALEKLYWHADFRYSLGMYYTTYMVRQMGVDEPSLQWVPSFPLGSNVVTLAELGMVYQTFLNGKLYRYFDNAQRNQILIIKKIADNQGHVLWEPKETTVPFADPFYSAPILDTMRGTVTAGTAYLKLYDNLILRSSDSATDSVLQQKMLHLPGFGKTGTTNNFTNGTYIGFLPYPATPGGTLSPENAYTIAAYVGYDSNAPMVNRWIHAAGGEAIPAWQQIALDIIKSKDFASKLDWHAIADANGHQIPFYYGDGLSQVIVPVHSGKALSLQTPEEDDDPNAKNDLYANDYSETGRHRFSVYLDGTETDNGFTPTRKISFFLNQPLAPAISTPAPPAR